MAHAGSISRATTVRQLVALTAALFIFVAALIALRAGDAVSDADWQVLAVSGEAEWRGPGVTLGGWQDLAANGRVPDGSELRTGGNGSAVVAKGLDRIELRSNTTLVVAARASSYGKMEVDQTSGSATYTVEKRPSGTFSVRTPYVVAVVKGTRFDVDIGSEETSVSVAEGRVGVSDARSGDSVDVTPGQKATSSRSSAGVDVSEAAAKGQPAAPKASGRGIPAAGSNAKTGGSAPGHSGEAPGRSGEAPGRSADSASSTGNGSGNGGGGSSGGDNSGGNAGGNGKGQGKG